MNLVPINSLFEIRYGNKFDFNKMILDEKGINFICRSREMLGFKAKVKLIHNLEPFDKGLITVTMGGTYLLSSFVQPERFYTAQNIKVLKPKHQMDTQIKNFYCAAIEKNRYKFTSHGREANVTFDTLLVPDLNDALQMIKNLNSNITLSNNSKTNQLLNILSNEWKTYKYSDVFIIKKGYYNKKPEPSENGSISFIGATATNNGVTGMYSLEDLEKNNRDGSGKIDQIKKKLFKGNTIAVTNNGSVGYAFYQSKDFTCSHDVNPLYLKEREFNIFIAMFMITVIEQDRYRWAYGRKWRPKRMSESTIKLPADKDGNPDWQFMEDYIKSLPYSSNLNP